MHRFYADDRGIRDGIAYLSPEDQQHALRVMRLRPGDACELLCGGARYAAVLADVSGGEAVLRVTGPLPSTEAKLRLTLFQGLPKGDKMDWIVQKAVELGAAAVTPVQMSRSVARIDPKDAQRRRDRWQKIAREAGKQSGRCVETEVSLPCSWKEFLARLPGCGLVLVPWEEAHGHSLARVRQTYPDLTQAAVVIGPEGGISREEMEEMKDRGAVPVTLGPRILRTETAGLAALAALFCLYGEMELS